MVELPRAEAVLDVAIFGAALLPMVATGLVLGAMGLGAKAGLALIDRALSRAQQAF